MPGDSIDDSEAKRVAFALACGVVHRACKRLARKAERKHNVAAWFATCEVDPSFEGENVRVTVCVRHGPKVYYRYDTHDKSLAVALELMSRELD